MNEKIEKLLCLIRESMENKKSCQVRINLHEGNVSEKVEIKEIRRLK